MTVRRGRGAWSALGAVGVALAVLTAGCSSDDGGGEPAPPGTGTPGERETGEEPGGSSAAPARGAAEVVETVASDLGSPWGIVRLPDGDLLVSSRDDAEILRVTAGSGEVSEVGRVPQARAGEGEGGLLGLALDPEFDATGRLFA